MDREQFNGAWQLVAAEYRCTDGSVITPFGSAPSGLLIYSADGYLSVQVGRRDRKPFAVDDMASAAPEEIRTAFTSYFGYFGRFTVDEPARLITHFIEGSTMPNWVGQEHHRHYAFTEGMLTLRATSTYFYSGNEVNGVLVWRRARGEDR